MKVARSLRFAVIGSIALSACGGPGRLIDDGPQKSTEGDVLSVAVALYPLAEIVETIGGRRVDVVNLTPPGSDAHGVELTAQQLESLNAAKITFYLGENYQPTVERSIKSLKTQSIDLLESLDLSAMKNDSHSEDHGSTHTGDELDPHVWLDPAYMVEMTRVITENLSQLRPRYAEEFSANASRYVDQLERLGNEIDSRFSRCASRTLVTAHYSFGYFARRAKLNVYSVANLNPDEQLSAKRLEELAAVVKKNKVATIFYEEMVSTDLARTLATKAGVSTDTLNPLEGMSQKDLDAGMNYFEVQKKNIDKIATSLSCS